MTERTFFRHFPNKRKVLFGGEVMVRTALTAAIADAPAGLGPLDMLFGAFRFFQPVPEESWSCSKPRREVISATPVLHERELAKMDALADALAVALRTRGVTDLRVLLASRIGTVAFAHATFDGLDDPEAGFGERLDPAFRELKALLGEGSRRSSLASPGDPAPALLSFS